MRDSTEQQLAQMVRYAAGRGTTHSAISMRMRCSDVAPMCAMSTGCTSRSYYYCRWDVLLVFLLAFTAIALPYEIAFIARQNWIALFWFNRLVDLVFLADMGV